MARLTKTGKLDMRGLGNSPQMGLTDRRVLFEEGLRIAEDSNKIISNMSGTAYTLSFLSKEQLAAMRPFATGTIVAYQKTGLLDKVGEYIEWKDQKSGERWVFKVPPKYRDEMHPAFFVDHPFWFLEKDGVNRVIHSDPNHVLQVNVGSLYKDAIGCYWYIWHSLSELAGKNLSLEEIRLFRRLKGRYRFRHGREKWDTGSENRSIAFVEGGGSRVGPVAMSRRLDDPSNIFRMNFSWTPGIKCSFMSSSTADITGKLLGNELTDGQFLALRSLTNKEMAYVTVSSTGERIPVPSGSLLSFLDGGSPVEFNCKGGTCRRCCTKVLGGQENLEEPDKREANAIGQGNIERGYRLFCQTRIRKGEIQIE